MVLGWSTTSSTRPCLESLPSIVRMAFSSCFNGLSYRVFPSWSRACAWCALLPTSRPTHTSMSSGVIIVPPVMKVFRSPRARRSPDARAAPTLRRDLRHAPLKRPCSRPGSYQRSSGVPVPGDNTPRIIDDRAGKSYRNRRPGPDHRGLPNMVMGGRPRVVAGYSYFSPLSPSLGGQLFRQRVLRYIIRISSSAPPPIISRTTTTSSALTRAT